MHPFFTFSIVVLLLSCTPKETAWDKEKVGHAIEYAQDIGTFSFVVQVGGEIAISYGDIDKVSRVHSVRKAILSALVFQNLDKIDLNATLQELKIQDAPIPLTDLQRTAKVIHLLKSTSGINHPAGSQTAGMQAYLDSLLGDEPNVPGSKWAYNNWDYNALTTILEQQVGLDTYEIFKKGIAKPLGMKNYEVIYRADTSLSQHAKAGFRLSTRDMAKFGQLFLDRGNWEGKQLIPGKWIEGITTDFTLTGRSGNERYGHGYLWWIPTKDYAGGIPSGSYLATGAWGQRILVIPGWDMVIAHKTMTEVPAQQRTPVSAKEFEELVRFIAEAHNR